jgi:hypothetical protein
VTTVPGQTCASCRHWLPPDGRTDYRNLFSGGITDRLYGLCYAIDLADSYEPAPDPPPLAVTKDGSDYEADLFTQAEFGCAMWEPDEGHQERRREELAEARRKQAALMGRSIP